MTVVKKPKAIDMLRSSQLRIPQQELMGRDVDLRGFYLAFKKKDINIEDAVIDVNIKRTIEGASTVTATVQDIDRTLLQSGKLSSRQDVEIDGLFFRLVAVNKSGSVLTLTFEDREVAILRTYNTPIKQGLRWSRANISRAQFIRRMLREVKELPPIPYVIPELNVQEPIAGSKQLPQPASRFTDKNYGIPPKSGLTVKGADMTSEQRKNANTIMLTGISRVAPLRPRPLLVMSMMAAIQESSIINLPYSFKNPNHRGVFQQDPRYWPASGDVATDSAAFFDRLVEAYQKNPGGQYEDLVESVQKSGYPKLYAQWRKEAEFTVTAFGVIDTTAADANGQWDPSQTVSGDYEFYRGIPPTALSQRKKGKTTWGPESSWDCMGRLADEVQWRRFFVSGTFYFLSDDNLFASQPIAVITEDTPGVLSLDGDYDENKRQANLSLTCLMDRWAAPPGGVIQIKNMGPWNGRWLVNDVERSAFNPNGTITLKKPLPRLPEPSGSNIIQGLSAAGTWTLTPVPAPSTKTPPGHFQVGPGLVQPVPAGYNTKIVQGVHDTVGLEGYPAADFGGDAGAPIIACETGKIFKLSGHDPILGPTDPVLGAHGPFGLSVYLQGKSGSKYYYTHMGTRTVAEGMQVDEGQVLGTIGDYAKWGGVNHVHCGVNPGWDEHPDIHDLLAAKLAAKPGTST